MGTVIPIGGSLSGLRLLAVDDDEDSLDVLRTLLETSGASVTIASSAREGLDVLATNIAVDLIISDIGMPEMDGYTFMRQVRSAESTAKIPAIALTAYAGAADAELAKRAGFQERLVKPFDQRILIATIKAWSRGIGRL